MTEWTREAISQRLEEIWEGVVTGRIGLHEIHPAIAGVYDCGYREGIRSVQPQLDRAEADADYWYARATNGPDFERNRDARVQAALLAADDAGELHGLPDVLVVAVAAATPLKRSAA